MTSAKIILAAKSVCFHILHFQYSEQSSSIY
nr:MAG TPA: hypothetical protein [Caudoviricetes sp.]